MDIAVEGCSGAELAALVHAKLLADGWEAHSIGVIMQNPDKSKHLETATTRVFGRQIDFVGLRAENYADESRVPGVRPGTAEEDAHRRDFTINALFYNLQSGQVEDFTGGLRHPQERVIQTPIASALTFSQDPLRMLRAIRFAIQLGFSLSAEICAAITTPDIVQRLQIVARSRYQQEVVKCFQHICAGLLMLCGFELLFEEIFLRVLRGSVPELASVAASQAVHGVRAFISRFYVSDTHMNDAI